MTRDKEGASGSPVNLEGGILNADSILHVAGRERLRSREEGSMLVNSPHISRGTAVQYSPLPAEGKERTVFQRWRDKWFRMELLIFWTLLGVGVGIAVGLGLYRANVSSVVRDLIGYPGELMIRALQELIMPLIAFALMTGVLNLRHNSGGIGRIIRWSLGYYILSMLLAVGVGIALVELIRPGNETTFTSDGGGVDSCGGSNKTTDGVSKSDKTVLQSLLNIGRDVIPTNIVSAAAENNFLGIIMFSVVFASALSTLGEEAEPFIRLIEIANKIILKIILAVIAFTPVGVASLIASTILSACNLGGLLKALGLYARGVSMTAGKIVVVVITATLAAIGAASIPNSALVTMITVLQALGFPEYIEDVAVLYAVDWFLGMIRTAVNIWGDACAVVVVDNWNKRYQRKHNSPLVIPRSSSSSRRQMKEDLRTVVADQQP